MSFDEALRAKVLLWCDRHCCLCKKACGINIEVHHIVPVADGGSDDIDNAIPLCFDCHGAVGHYNDRQPKGSKYRSAELKARREQVYEEFTRHLVPPIHYQITNVISPERKRTFPDVGLMLTHHGDSLPVKVKTRIEVVRDNEPSVRLLGLYGGYTPWNLNPGFHVSGHFDLPAEVTGASEIRVRMLVTIVDQYEREHSHLPVHYVYRKEGNYWFFDA